MIQRGLAEEAEEAVVFRHSRRDWETDEVVPARTTVALAGEVYEPLNGGIERDLLDQVEVGGGLIHVHLAQLVHDTHAQVLDDVDGVGRDLAELSCSAL